MFKKCNVRMGCSADYLNRAALLESIADDVHAGRFRPTMHGFLSSSKGNGVARFVPVLTYESTAVYFACVKALDEICADLAVENTFGGWSLGGKRRKSEEQVVKALLSEPQPVLAGTEANGEPPVAAAPTPTVNAEQPEEPDILDDSDIDVPGSMPSSPYNKAAWVANWQEFWKVLAATEEQIPDGFLLVSLDVANFYDTVDLVRLRKRLTEVAGHLGGVLSVLFKFLADWNQAMRFYEPTSKGVPMDIVGDMSRVLTNFYLIEFDVFMKERVEAVGGKYTRWSDDITFTCPSQEASSALLFAASEKLHELGLNINTAKVRVRTREEFKRSWGFDVMDLLEQEDRLDDGLLMLKERWDDPAYERKETAIRRALGLLRARPESGAWRQWVYQNCLTVSQFALRLSHGQMHSLITISDDAPSAARDLCAALTATPYSEPKTHLLRCLERQRTNKDKTFGELFDKLRSELLESGDAALVLAATNSPYGAAQG